MFFPPHCQVYGSVCENIKNHQYCATKHLQMWHNLMCCLLTQKQIWVIETVLYLKSLLFVPLGMINYSSRRFTSQSGKRFQTLAGFDKAPICGTLHQCQFLFFLFYLLPLVSLTTFISEKPQALVHSGAHVSLWCLLSLLNMPWCFQKRENNDKSFDISKN